MCNVASSSRVISSRVIKLNGSVILRIEGSYLQPFAILPPECQVLGASQTVHSQTKHNRLGRLPQLHRRPAGTVHWSRTARRVQCAPLYKDIFDGNPNLGHKLVHQVSYLACLVGLNCALMIFCPAILRIWIDKSLLLSGHLDRV